MLNYNDIIKDDHPNLRLKSKEVELPLSPKDEETLNLMNEYLVNSLDPIFCEENNIRPGVGLAAPQINVLKQMFAIFAEDEKGRLFHYGIINPKILSHSEELTFLPNGEGCLSIDRIEEGIVPRYRRIRARVHLYDFNTKELIEREIRLKDYLAIVFQHEYDHLNGMLFIDRIDKENPFNIPEGATPIQFNLDNDE